MTNTDVTRPDRTTLVAFAAFVVIGGANFLAVKVTLRELAPFWSAGVRFSAAALLLIAFLLVRRMALPRGRALAGTLLFGALSFAGFYAFAYWAIQGLPAGAASILAASAPLVTFGAAVSHGLEPFRWRTLAGSLLAIGGIAVMFGGAAGGELPLPRVLAVLAATFCAAEAAVVAKRTPPVSPVVMSGLGMGVGGVALLVLSFAVGEPHVAPFSGPTWTALLFLVLVGSIALFVTYLFVLGRWTASGASYAFVLFPVVAVALSSWIEDEAVTWGLVLGGALVVAGVYVGALSRARAPAEATEEPDRPELAGVPADCLRCP